MRSTDHSKTLLEVRPPMRQLESLVEDAVNAYKRFHHGPWLALRRRHGFGVLVGITSGVMTQVVESPHGAEYDTIHKAETWLTISAFCSNLWVLTFR